jgi:hypothetical protein
MKNMKTISVVEGPHEDKFASSKIEDFHSRIGGSR